MNKGLVVGGLAAVIGGGYFAGVAMTAKQVDQQFPQYVEALKKSYQGVAEVEAETQDGTFSSHSTLSLSFLDLPPELVEWAGTDTIKFDINNQHGFLKSDTVVTLADGPLLTKLASYQANPTQPLLQVNATYNYDVGDSSVSIVGDMSLDSFLIEEQGDTVELGKGSGTFDAHKDTLNVVYAMAPSQVLASGMSFNIGTITFNETVKALGGDILTAKMSESALAELVVDNIDVKGNGVDVALSDFAIGVNQAIVGDRMDLGVSYSAEQLKFKQRGQDFQFDQPKLDISADLDSQAVIAFVEELQALQARSGGNIEDPQEVLPLLEPIAEKGINVNIDALQVSAAGGRVNGDAVMELAPFTLMEAMTDQAGMRKKVDLNAKLAVDKAFLLALPNFDPQQAQFAVSMGFIEEVDDSYKVTMTFKDGQVVVNGNPMPLF